MGNPLENTQRNYNFIYSKLVNEDSDLIGHIAYSLYKKSKVEYIKDNKTDGTPLTDNELIPFNKFSSTDSSVESYRIKAELLLQGFINNVLAEELDSYKNQAINQQADILKDVIKPLTPSFWKSVGIGLVSAFIFALLLAAIAFILQFQNSTINFTVAKDNTEQTE